jgi:four helix bundle protein
MRNDLEERLLDFGARVIRLVEALPKSVAGRRLGDQLLRSGTSVGANFEEAQAAESKEDFVHKLQVALKEARESTYWLRLIARSKLLKPERVDGLIDESQQIRAILSKSVATVKGKAK